MKNFFRGMKAGIPIALGYLSVSFTFGIIAVSYGFTWWEAVIISMTTVTSAGQFSGIQTMRLPGQYLDMIISQFTINVRYSFMSVSLTQKVDKKFSGIWRWIFGFFMTDEIFAVAASEKSVSRGFFAGLSSLPWVGWALGTLLGAILGNVLPPRIMSALGIAIYGMFVAIVVPEMTKCTVKPFKHLSAVTIIVLIAAVLSTLFKYMPVMNKVSSGIAISICAVAAAALGAILFPLNDSAAEASLNDGTTEASLNDGTTEASLNENTAEAAVTEPAPAANAEKKEVQHNA